MAYKTLKSRENPFKVVRRYGRDNEEEVQVSRLTRPLTALQPSFPGFQEMLARFLELRKAERLLAQDPARIKEIDRQIEAYEMVLGHLDAYIEGTLIGTFFREASSLNFVGKRM